MPQILPIHAIRYAISDKASGGTGDVSGVIAPPYDVLDEGPKQKMLAADPHNIVAIDLPVTPPKTVGPDEAYRKAGDLFRKWLAEGVLRHDLKPALFAYEQSYTSGGETFSRRGLFTNLVAEEFGRVGGGIHRHELTIQGGTDDRLKLMEATAAQLSPVFGVYDDVGRRVAALLKPIYARTPDFTGTTGNDGVEHRVWIITDKRKINALDRNLLATDVFIADGHHRYTTALNYSKRHPENAAAKNALFVLVAISDPGLRVLPTHRVLCGLSGFKFKEFAQVIADDKRFKLTPTNHGAAGVEKLAHDLPTHRHHALGILDPESGGTFVLTTPDHDPLVGTMSEKPRVWRELDVAVLHYLFIDQIVKPRYGGSAITYKYPHELTEMVRLTRETPGRLGIIMQPTALKSVCDVSRAAEVMPPKSTFFFPKLATGLVINPLD